MKVSSLRPVDIQTIQRVVLSQIEMAVNLPMGEELHVYPSFPAQGSGPIAVDVGSALHDIASLEAEAAGDDELYIFCGNSLTDLADLIEQMSQQMHQAAADLQFELAARLRDEVGELKKELRQMKREQ